MGNDDPSTPFVGAALPGGMMVLEGGFEPKFVTMTPAGVLVDDRPGHDALGPLVGGLAPLGDFWSRPDLSSWPDTLPPALQSDGDAPQRVISFLECGLHGSRSGGVLRPADLVIDVAGGFIRLTRGGRSVILRLWGGPAGHYMRLPVTLADELLAALLEAGAPPEDGAAGAPPAGPGGSSGAAGPAQVHSSDQTPAAPEPSSNPAAPAPGHPQSGGNS